MARKQRSVSIVFLYATAGQDEDAFDRPDVFETRGRLLLISWLLMDNPETSSFLSVISDITKSHRYKYSPPLATVEFLSFFLLHVLTLFFLSSFPRSFFPFSFILFLSFPPPFPPSFILSFLSLFFTPYVPHT